MKRLRMTQAAAVLLALFALSEAGAASRPLKVYILAGQSNMQGHAHKRTLAYAAKDPVTKPLVDRIIDEKGEPRVHNNIYIDYMSEEPAWGKPDPRQIYKKGALTIGYGSDSRNPHVFGPELIFGTTIQDKYKEPVLIIKTAWGGKSLHTDFRSPSAGPYVFRPEVLEEFKKHGKDVKEIQAGKARQTGHYYRQMVTHIKKVLKDIKSVYPDYDKKAGYELAGFVWFQGFNDLVDNRTYGREETPDKYRLYSDLLTAFIKDVRKDLKAPKMPFVIGVIGIDGDNTHNNMKALRTAMAAPASLPGFKGNVAAVETKVFWDDAMAAAQPRQHKMNVARERAHGITEEGLIERRAEGQPGWDTIGTVSREEREWRYISFDPPENERREIGKHRQRKVTLPAGTEGWYKPGFDDRSWSKGKAPIGTGIWKRHRKIVKNRSEWGKGEFLLMRTTFNIKDLKWEKYRISVLARQGFRIYLNGREIHYYHWWKKEPFYRSIILNDHIVKQIKEGDNLLAVYANVEYDKSFDKPYASIDVDIEGITKEGMAAEQKRRDAICSPADREILEGASNGGYHYMGSAKIITQIGKAFAEAMIKLRQ